MCNSCPYGNLQKRHLNSNPIFREIEVGEEWELDIKDEWTDDKGKPCSSFL